MTEIQAPPARTTFPLEHQLYGRLERLEDASLLTPDALAAWTNANPVDATVTEFGECPRCYFQTSGTSGQSKRIPFTAADLEAQIDHEARSFAVAGLTAEDRVMTLASPPPSLSAWATVAGSERLGAEALNSSYVDFDRILDAGRGAEVTFVFGTPLMLELIGRMTEETFGPVDEVFPNLRAGILYGDVLPPAVERRVRRYWPIDIRLLYGSVEADVIAMSCPDGDRTMHVMDKVVVELLIDGASDPVRVEECPDGTRGEVIVSDLDRELLPLIRYATGDIVQVHRSRCGCGRGEPRLSVLGRRKNELRLGGRALHEMELHAVTDAVLGDRLHDWQLDVDRHGRPDVHAALRVSCRGAVAGDVAGQLRERLVALGALVAEQAERVLEVVIDEPSDEQRAPDGDVKADRIRFR
ncbi:AMP-binding protein [Patulibacter medicamentivorans]|uniref:AMP-binding protein n=1 Tax=Patulibacter medicamentivorans TaxID=1097667 RepID=H0E169_9ACTN|nr:AMP-binding protein [Patulibacter medicamentivorans]EHN12589.1 AMP-binding protein [Patulibacter medicamentivorans]